MNIVYSPTKRTLPARMTPVVAIIVHTTGSTYWPAIINFYQSPDGLQPHYCIETNGTIHMVVDEDRVAYHCAIQPLELRLYQRGYIEWSRYLWLNGQPVGHGKELPNYAQWRDTWLVQGINSPINLVTNERPNSKSIGIELQQPEQAGPDVFTDAQYQALGALCADISTRRSVPIDRAHVLGHYDCCPLRRSNSKGGTDPGRAFNWLRLLELAKALS